MTNLGLFMPIRSSRTTRMLTCAAAAASVLAVTGCSLLKDTSSAYAASANAQERAAAEASAETKSRANIDSKATYLQLVEQMQKEACGSLRSRISMRLSSAGACRRNPLAYAPMPCARLTRPRSARKPISA